MASSSSTVVAAAAVVAQVKLALPGEGLSDDGAAAAHVLQPAATLDSSIIP